MNTPPLSEKDAAYWRHLGEGFYHEALDRTWIVMNMMQTYLLDHPAFINPEHQQLRTTVESAQTALWGVYLTLGILALGDEFEPVKIR